MAANHGSIAMVEFWNIEGRPIAYVDDDGESIYLWDGMPVAWLEGDAIYAYSGRFLGWFVDGWVRDIDGDVVFFTDNAQGGPVKPVRQVRPVRGVRGVRPIRGVREIRPIRAVRSLNWSAHSDESWFLE